MIQDIFVIGASGKVGRTLVKQMFEREDDNPETHPNPTRIVGLVSLNKFAYKPEGLSYSECNDFVKENNKFQKHESLNQLLDMINKNRKSMKSTFAFIDVTASNKPLTDFHLKVIKETPYGIVTANKNPIALPDYKVFQQLTKVPRRYGYRCSVMAGAEAVTFLRDLKDVSDSPSLIEGCFSGTLGFIATELEKGRKFSEIIREATENGYTEPDPRDDLNGLDVARKLIVLARTAGYKIGMEDIDLKPFIPKKYFSDETIEEFFKKTNELDDYFKEKFVSANENNKTLRYIAKMEANDNSVKLQVGLEEVDKGGPLGSLKGTQNKLVVVSKAYPKSSPYSVEAPGAGLEVTAQNIRRDLLYLLKGRKIISSNDN